MARIMEEQELRNNRNKLEGYMVAVDADTYEEARALAYQRYEAVKPELKAEYQRQFEQELEEALRAGYYPEGRDWH